MRAKLVTLLGLLGLTAALQVLLPASGNHWDLERLDYYSIVWSSVDTDPSHIHVSLHDAAGKVVYSCESVRTHAGTYLISGMSGIPSGSGYRVILSDPKNPTRKILARSGKFSIRQVAGASSSGIIDDDPLTSVVQGPTITPPTAATTSTIVFDNTPTTAPASGFLSPSGSAGTSPENTPASSSSAKTSKTSSSRTSTTAATTSTGFPKFVIPSEKGLSTGSKVGIAVGVSIIVLFILGSGLVFWRRRRPRHQDEGAHWSDPAAGQGMIAEYHGKPELVGDEAHLYERDIGTGYVDKPEVQTQTLSTPGYEGTGQLNENQALPPHMAELPQRSGSPGASESTRVADLAQQPHVGDRGRSAAAELDPARPRPDEFVAGSSPAELPDARNGNSSQFGEQPQLSMPVELPVSPPSVDHNSVSQTIQAAEPTPPIQPLWPPSTLSPQNAPEDPDLEALRRRERDLLESISAAETLERLRREHREVQEQIRLTEAGKVDGSSGR